MCQGLPTARPNSIQLGGDTLEVSTRNSSVWRNFISTRGAETPLAFGTQIDEDFVGRLATISRMVSVRTVHTRTLGRYQVALAARW